jgi:lipoprotein Spr
LEEAFPIIPAIPVPLHVGIYVGFNLFILFIHASVSSGVTVSSLKSDYYRKRFVGARRIIE